MCPVPPRRRWRGKCSTRCAICALSSAPRHSLRPHETRDPFTLASIEDPDRVADSALEIAVALSRRIAPAPNGAVGGGQELLDQTRVAVAAEGHIVREDLPGVGKTTRARARARSMKQR